MKKVNGINSSDKLTVTSSDCVQKKVEVRELVDFVEQELKKGTSLIDIESAIEKLRVSCCGSNCSNRVNESRVNPCIMGKKASEDDIESARGVAVNSKWYLKTLANGEVWTPYTNRRFLPAQYMHMMVDFKSIDEAIARRYSLYDCFIRLKSEIENLIFMKHHCKIAFEERSQFLSVESCTEIIKEYLLAFRDNINDRSKCTFNKRTHEYVRFIEGYDYKSLWCEQISYKEAENGESSETKSILATDFLKKINKKIDSCIESVLCVKSYEDALFILRKFPWISMGMYSDSKGNLRYWLPKTWKEAFKKEGAYYTLKSLILNRRVIFTSRDNKCISDCDSLDAIRKLSDPGVPAYIVHAILKKSICDSRFSIAKFLNEIQ